MNNENDQPTEAAPNEEAAAAPSASVCSCGAVIDYGEGWPDGDGLMCQMCWKSCSAEKFWEVLEP